MIDFMLKFTFTCDECGRKQTVRRSWRDVYSRIGTIKPEDYIKDSGSLLDVHEDGTVLCKNGDHLEEEIDV